MYNKFSDKQLKVVSDSISECLFYKNFLGGHAPRPPRRLVLRTPGYNTSALWLCNFRNGQPNLVLIGHSVLAIISPYIVLWAPSATPWGTRKRSEQLVQAHEQVDESYVRVQEYKLLLNNAKSANEKLETELAQPRARHKLMVQEAAQAWDKAELEHFRAVEVECAKWEVREAHLSEQLGQYGSKGGASNWVVVTTKDSPATLPRVLSSEGSTATGESDSVRSSDRGSYDLTPTVVSWAGSPLAAQVLMEGFPWLLTFFQHHHIQGQRPLTTPFTVAEMPCSRLALPYVPMGAGQQVQPLSKFSGADIDGESESFEEWVEQFELIADMYGWDPRAWLVNLTTRLQGQAYNFYRTCSPQQRAHYELQLLTLRRRR